MKRAPADAISRSVAAILGGYALTALLMAALAVVMQGGGGAARIDAAGAGLLASFGVYTIVVIAVFSARSAARAWMGLVLSALVALLALLLWGGGPR